jgi:hypothetical protein
MMASKVTNAQEFPCVSRILMPGLWTCEQNVNLKRLNGQKDLFIIYIFQGVLEKRLAGG